MEQRPRIQQVAWGLLGAAAAAWFAIWMLFFPQYVPEFFAWDVHPRAAQAFIGAGYIFRTFFFLNAACEGNWIRLRWIVYGNLAFTGTLLFATYWHLDEFHWNPLETPLAHIWIVLYIFEPVVMLYLIPRGILRAEAPVSGGPAPPGARSDSWSSTTGILLMNGLLIVVNPEFAATRWPWELNPLDARIVGGVVPGLGVLVRDDGLRHRLGRDQARVPALHPQRRRSCSSPRSSSGTNSCRDRGTRRGLRGRACWSCTARDDAVCYLLQERQRPAPGDHQLPDRGGDVAGRVLVDELARALKVGHGRPRGRATCQRASSAALKPGIRIGPDDERRLVRRASR